MLVDMCRHMFANKCADMCAEVCADMCADTCVDVCIDMCADAYVDMFVDMCGATFLGFGHVREPHKQPGPLRAKTSPFEAKRC